MMNKFLHKSARTKRLWAALLILFCPFYTVQTVGPSDVFVIAGHGKELLLVDTRVEGDAIGILPRLFIYYIGWQPQTLEEDTRCYDLSDPGKPVFTLRGVHLTGIVGSRVNVYVRVINKSNPDNGDDSDEEDRLSYYRYLRFTPAGFVNATGTELQRVATADDRNELLNLGAIPGDPPVGHGWTLPTFHALSAPTDGVGTTVDSLIIPAVDKSTSKYELRDIVVYGSNSAHETLDLRRIDPDGPRQVIYKFSPVRFVSPVTNYKYMLRG